jgi:hypothetical protein
LATALAVRTGIPERQDEDAGPERDAPRRPGHQGQGGERLHEHDAIRRRRIEQVVEHPQSVEAEILGPAGEVLQEGRGGRGLSGQHVRRQEHTEAQCVLRWVL